MAHSHKDGHGRCAVCGDEGETRRKREADALRADERELVATEGGTVEITGDTTLIDAPLSDEDYRKLADRAWYEFVNATRAHSGGTVSEDERREARARCAEILNARNGASS